MLWECYAPGCKCGEGECICARKELSSIYKAATWPRWPKGEQKKEARYRVVASLLDPLSQKGKSPQEICNIIPLSISRPSTVDESCPLDDAENLTLSLNMQGLRSLSSSAATRRLLVKLQLSRYLVGFFTTTTFAAVAFDCGTLCGAVQLGNLPCVLGFQGFASLLSVNISRLTSTFAAACAKKFMGWGGVWQFAGSLSKTQSQVCVT